MTSYNSNPKLTLPPYLSHTERLKSTYPLSPNLNDIIYEWSLMENSSIVQHWSFCTGLKIDLIFSTSLDDG